MPQSTPPLPPTPPAPGAYVARVSPTPVASYEAALAQREVLGQQLDRLNGERENLAEQARQVGGVDRAGVEARIVAIDARIAALDKQIAQADQKVAETAAIPGAVSGHQSEQRWRNQHDGGDFPEALIAIPIVFFITVLFPLSIALSRRIWRRTAASVAALPTELMERMARLEQGLDSIAVEVERIGEGQRFMTKVLTDAGGRSLAGAAQQVAAPRDR